MHIFYLTQNQDFNLLNPQTCTFNNYSALNFSFSFLKVIGKILKDFCERVCNPYITFNIVFIKKD